MPRTLRRGLLGRAEVRWTNAKLATVTAQIAGAAEVPIVLPTDAGLDDVRVTFSADEIGLASALEWSLRGSAWVAVPEGDGLRIARSDSLTAGQRAARSALTKWMTAVAAETWAAEARRRAAEPLSPAQRLAWSRGHRQAEESVMQALSPTGVVVAATDAWAKPPLVDITRDAPADQGSALERLAEARGLRVVLMDERFVVAAPDRAAEWDTAMPLRTPMTDGPAVPPPTAPAVGPVAKATPPVARVDPTAEGVTPAPGTGQRGSTDIPAPTTKVGSAPPPVAGRPGLPPVLPDPVMPTAKASRPEDVAPPTAPAIPAPATPVPAPRTGAPPAVPQPLPDPVLPEPPPPVATFDPDRVRSARIRLPAGKRSLDRTLAAVAELTGAPLLTDDATARRLAVLDGSAEFTDARLADVAVWLEAVHGLRLTVVAGEGLRVSARP